MSIKEDAKGARPRRAILAGFLFCGIFLSVWWLNGDRLVPLLQLDRPKFSTADLQRTGQSDPGRPASQDFTPEEQRAATSARQRDRNKGGPEPQARMVVAGSESGGEPPFPLFSSAEVQGLRSRWEGVQVHFVDEPRNSVKQADQPVAEAIRHLAETFATERQKLEHQWDRGDKVSTEDLRLSLCCYRSFFERLLSV